MPERARPGAVAGSGGRPSPSARRPRAKPENDDVETTVGAIAGGGLNHLISTTMPDELLRHNISDEELDVLCDPARDELWELKWGALGAFLAALPSAIDGIYDYSRSQNGEIGIVTLIQLIITVTALAVWLVLRYIVPQKTARSNDKRDEIRARSKRIQEGASGGLGK